MGRSSKVDLPSSPDSRWSAGYLLQRVRRVAAAGRLAVPEARAVGFIQSAGVGVITTLLATPSVERDPGLAVAVFDGVLAQILTDAPAAARSGPTAAAVAFRAVAPELDQLSDPE